MAWPVATFQQSVICFMPQEDEMVARMLLFRKNMLSVLHNSFASHADFAQALKEGKFVLWGCEMVMLWQACE